MPRPSKLTTAQCERIRLMKTDREHPVPAPQLAKQFKVSESSIYKVLDGSYIPRQEPAAAKRKTAIAVCGTTPLVPPKKPVGAMPSIFQKEFMAMQTQKEPPAADSTLAEILERAAKADLAPVDELTVAAAELVLARHKLTKLLAAA